MNYSLTPAVISFFVITLYGLFHFLRDIRNRRSRLQIFRIKFPFISSIEKMKDFFLVADYPLEIDFVVENLSGNTHIYVTVNDRNIKKAKEQLINIFPKEKVFETNGHLTVYQSGINDAYAAAMTTEEFENFDLSKLRFDSVKAVGENLVYRFVKTYEMKNVATIKMETVCSARSNEQLEKIKYDIKQSFVDKKLLKPKNVDAFINHFNYHELQSK